MQAAGLLFDNDTLSAQEWSFALLPGLSVAKSCCNGELRLTCSAPGGGVGADENEFSGVAIIFSTNTIHSSCAATHFHPFFCCTPQMHTDLMVK